MRNLKIAMVMLFWAGMAHGENSTIQSIPDMQIQPFSRQWEGVFECNKTIPIEIVSGTREHPELVEIKGIRFETNYGNAWGVFVQVGWSSEQESQWRVGIELLDQNRTILPHARDKATYFVTELNPNVSTARHYTTLALPGMQFEGRWHSSRFRLHLEPVALETELPSDSNRQHSLELKAIHEETQESLADVSIQVTTRQKDTSRFITTLHATDVHGLCHMELPLTNWSLISLIAEKDGYASLLKNWTREQTPPKDLPKQYTLELLPAQPIGGIIQDEQGTGIADADVRINAHFPVSTGILSVNRVVGTDSAGRWDFKELARDIDRISLFIMHPKYISGDSNNLSLTGELLHTAQSLAHVTVLKKSSTMLSGKILNDQGQPVLNAGVILSPKDQNDFRHNYAHTFTDEAGTFRFENMRNDWQDSASGAVVVALLVEAVGYTPTLQQVVITPDMTPPEITLLPGRTIPCRVVDPQGLPLSQAWTVIQPFPDYRYYSRWQEDTDDQGRFQIKDAPAQDIFLTVGKKGFITVRDYVLKASELEPVVVMKPILCVRGKVTDSKTGQPIPYFEVLSGYVDDNNQPLYRSWTETVWFMDGEYEITFDEAFRKKRMLEVQALGYQGVFSEVFSMEEGDKNFDFKLAPDPAFDTQGGQRSRGQIQPPPSTESRKITGRVRDQKGEPVAGAVVSTRPWVGEPTVTNAEGKFTFRSTRRNSNTPREEILYLLIRHKEQNLSQAIELGKEVNELNIQLEKGTILSGKIIDQEGKGMPEAKISLTFWVSDTGYGSSEPVSIDNDGCYEIRAIPLGHRYSVNASAEGYGEQYIELDTNDSANNRMVLEPLVLYVANLNLSGVVVDELDNPVPNIRVSAYGRGQPHRDTTTDADGNFTLKNLCAGSVRVQANQQGERRKYGKVETKGGTSDVKIVVTEVDASGQRIQKQPPSLLGKPLPELTGVAMDFNPTETKDKSILFCFCDMNQRPSRHCVEELVKKAEELKGKGVVVALVQTIQVEQKDLEEWIAKYQIPFPVGMIKENPEKTLFIWGVRGQPWLILTDRQHIVRAEGFSIDELDEKLKDVK